MIKSDNGTSYLCKLQNIGRGSSISGGNDSAITLKKIDSK
jgi:hypothetical protein